MESRLYKESMTGATAKSKPKTSKIDERELARLQRQDYWLQISRAKLVMDLIFVCACSFVAFCWGPKGEISSCVYDVQHTMCSSSSGERDLCRLLLALCLLFSGEQAYGDDSVKVHD